MKIGITLSLREDYESMWINGIKLNVLNLAKTLQQIEGNEVWVLDTGNKVEDLKKVTWDYRKYPIYKYSEKWKELDLLIMLGTSLPKNLIDAIKQNNPNAKVVKYQCGNNYVIDMERAIFDTAGDAPPSWDPGHDQTWFIPQQQYHNEDYYATIYRQESKDVLVVPFVWDPEHIDRHIAIMAAAGKKIPVYEPKPRSEKKLSVMEPNMNVVKFSMIPLMIAEQVYRSYGDGAFKQIYIGSGQKILKNEYYKKMINYLDLVRHQPPLVKYVGRYPVTTFLAEETDIVVSHQWENPLNYAYLDAMHLKYPILHNAEFVKDGGYYYPDFKVLEGANILNDILENHDNNIEEYNAKNKMVLDRYLTTNPGVVDTYRKLLDNLFNPGSHEMGEYDKKTNTIK